MKAAWLCTVCRVVALMGKGRSNSSRSVRLGALCQPPLELLNSTWAFHCDVGVKLEHFCMCEARREAMAFANLIVPLKNMGFGLMESFQCCRAHVCRCVQAKAAFFSASRGDPTSETSGGAGAFAFLLLLLSAVEEEDRAR